MYQLNFNTIFKKELQLAKNPAEAFDMYSCACDSVFSFSVNLLLYVGMGLRSSLRASWKDPGVQRCSGSPFCKPLNYNYEGTSFKNFISFLAQFLIVYVGLLVSQEQREAFSWMRYNITVHLTSSDRKMVYSGVTKVYFTVAISITKHKLLNSCGPVNHP